MSGSSPSLRELIEIDELQSIQDSFARAAGISSVILSPEGEPLTKFTDPTGFCSLIQSTEKGRERCFRSFMEMGEIALLSETPEICYCFAHGGHFVAPIMIDGEHKGTMFAGQFIPEKFSSKQLRNLEEIEVEIDLDPGLLVKEAEKMRVVGEDVIRNYSSLLFQIVETIARMGAQAAELERRVQERTAELAEANRGLEQEVAERKLAEEALRESEEFSSSLLDNSPDPILVVNPDTSLRYVNHAFEELTGFSSAEVVGGKPPYHWWTEETQQNTSRDLVEAMREGARHLEELFQKKNGERFRVEITSTPVKRKGEFLYYLANWVDITERKKAEEALRESEEKVRTLYASSSDAIMLLGEKGFFDCNDATLRLFGCASREEFCIRHPADFSPPTQPDGTDSMSYARNNIAVALKEGTKRFEHLHRRLDGTDFPAEVLLDAMVLGGKKVLQARVYDITERKAMENALQESEERLKEILEHLQTGIVIIDAETHEIVDINSLAAKMIGAPKEEIIGNLCHTFICPAEIGKCPITDLGQAIDNSERELVKANGETIPVLKTVVPVTLSDRQYLIDSFIDISERKRAEEALKKKADELERFNRLAVGRELKMIELKKEINALLGESGKEPGYTIVGEP